MLRQRHHSVSLWNHDVPSGGANKCNLEPCGISQLYNYYMYCLKNKIPTIYVRFGHGDCLHSFVSTSLGQTSTTGEMMRFLKK